MDKHCYMGSVDNTINRVMETYILTPPSERAQLRLFRESEMEDTAVMMAINNHGLVHSADEITHDQWSSDDAISYSSPANHSTELSSESNDSNSACPNSRTFQQFDKQVKHNWSTDEIDDADDEQQEILERAVAEAIKIKGLSALSVDYG